MLGYEIGLVGILLLVVAALALVLYLVPIPLWIAAWASGAYVGLLTLVGMRFRRVPPGTVVNARISAVKEGGLRIGALATLSEIERAPAVRREAPVIARTLRTLANVRVRNVATLGGHLAHADPHLDLPPVLIALGASVEISGANGVRTVPLEQLYSGYLETTLARGELIAEVRIPRQRPRCAAYLKCTTRAADDWPALCVAVLLDRDVDRVRDARMVVSAATDTPTRLKETEKALCQRLEEAARYIDLDRLAVSPQCGFASTAAGNPLSEADQRAKLALVVDTARAVWGEP